MKKLIDLDRAYLEEYLKFKKLEKDFDEVFDDHGNSTSRLDVIRKKFLKEFNKLGAMLLKSQKKVKVSENKEKRYNGAIFVGGKSGLSDRDYGGDGLTDRKDIIDFFLNLDKVDIILKGALTKHYYDKWLSFISCFEFGVDKILLSNSNFTLAGELSKDFDDEILVKAEDDDEDGHKPDKFRVRKLTKIGVKADEDGNVNTYLEIAGKEVDFNDFDGDESMFFIRNYLKDMLDLERQFRAQEEILVRQQAEQYEAFVKKSIPHMALGEL